MQIDYDLVAVISLIRHGLFHAALVHQHGVGLRLFQRRSSEKGGPHAGVADQSRTEPVK